MRIIFLNWSQTRSTAGPFVDGLDMVERYTRSDEAQFASIRPKAKLCRGRKGPIRNKEEGRDPCTCVVA